MPISLPLPVLPKSTPIVAPQTSDDLPRMSESEAKYKKKTHRVKKTLISASPASTINASDASNTPDLDAVRLVDAIKDGSRKAEDDFVRRYSPGLTTILRIRCSDSELCKDIAQETMRITIQRLRSGLIEQPNALAGFLRGTALNLLTNELRRSERRLTDSKTDALDNLIAESCDPYETLESEDLAKMVRQIIGGLKMNRDRELLWRYYIDQASKDQLCAHFELSAEHFDRVLHRAKLRLKQVWKNTTLWGLKSS